MSTAARSAIDAENRRFVENFNRGDVDAAIGVYTQNARIMPPGAPIIQGRDAIRDFWSSAVDQMGIRGVDLRTIEVRATGESTALELGSWTMKGDDGELGHGTYMVHWKEEDGSWRWDWDIWNADA